MSEEMRRQSSAGFVIEEISPDDMGYDGDIEIVKPDNYEEVDSETDISSTPRTGWHAVDDDLASRMSQLGRGHSPIHPGSNTDRGRKRRSTAMDAGDNDDDRLLKCPRSPELEVQEVLDGTSQPSPAKRRKIRSKHSEFSHHLLQNSMHVQPDSLEIGEAMGRARREVSTSSAASIRGNEDTGDDEMVDVS